jgi:hypothetical protein
MPICICTGAPLPPGLMGFSCRRFWMADAGRERVALVGKDHEQAVAQQLDDPALVLLEHLAEHADELRHEARRGLIAQPFKHAGAAHKIGKNNGCHEGKVSRNVSILFSCPRFSQKFAECRR